VDHPGDLVLAHHPHERVLVRDVAAHHGDIMERCFAKEHAHPPRIVAEIVDHGALAGGEEPLHHPGPDAAERARDQRRHRSKPPVWV
jgi:hypothetical protein